MSQTYPAPLLSGISNSFSGWLIAATCLTVTALAWFNANDGSRQDEQAYFESQTNNMALHIERSLSLHEQAIRDAATLVASKAGSRSELRSHSGTLSSVATMAGTQEIAFCPATDSAKTPPPSESGASRQPIKMAYIPSGYPAFSTAAVPNDLLGHALSSAASSPSASSRSNGPQPASDYNLPQATLLLYLPVHMHDESGRHDRRAGKVAGYVYTSVQLGDFIESLRGDTERRLRVKFFEGQAATPESLLYDSKPAPAPAQSPPEFSKTIPIDIHGHHWTIQFEAAQPGLPYSSKGRSQAYILVGGLLLSLTLLGAAISRSGSRQANSSKQTLQELKNQIDALEARRDQEQKRLAQEMHDDLGQLLAAMKMDLVCLSRHIPADEIMASRHLNSINELVNAMMTSVRRIISDLPPQALDDLGLFDALRLMAKKFEERHQIRCRVHLPASEPHMAPRATSAIYRMIQESLNNVAKHACATNVEIRMETFGNRLELSIADNGKGFSASALHKAGSFGLITMRERAASLNGSMKVESTSGAGTIVHITLSLDENLQRCTEPDKPTLLSEGV